MARKYIAIAQKGKEFFYKKDTVIQCRSEKQAMALCEHLNKNNNTSNGIFKCKENEVWHMFEDLEAVYKIKTTNGVVKVVLI